VFRQHLCYPLVRAEREEAGYRMTGFPHRAFLVGTSPGSRVEQPSRHQHLADRLQNAREVGGRHMQQAVQGIDSVEGGRKDSEAEEVRDACVQALRSAQRDHGRGQVGAQDPQALPLEVQRVLPGTGTHLQQADCAAVLEQLKEAPPLVNLERLLHPAVAICRRGRPVRLAKADKDAVGLLHSQDRTSVRTTMTQLSSFPGTWPPHQTVPRGWPAQTLRMVRSITLEAMNPADSERALSSNFVMSLAVMTARTPELSSDF
jgi:hypothetical protein